MSTYENVVYIGVTPDFSQYRSAAPRVDANKVDYASIEKYFMGLPSTRPEITLCTPCDYIDIADMEMMLKLGDEGGMRVYAEDLMDAARKTSFTESLFKIPRWQQHHVLKDRSQAAPPGILAIVASTSVQLANTQWYFELAEDLNIKAANVGRIVDKMTVRAKDMEGTMPAVFKNILEDAFSIKFTDRVTIHRVI